LESIPELIISRNCLISAILGIDSGIAVFWANLMPNRKSESTVILDAPLFTPTLLAPWLASKFHSYGVAQKGQHLTSDGPGQRPTANSMSQRCSVFLHIPVSPTVLEQPAIMQHLTLLGSVVLSRQPVFFPFPPEMLDTAESILPFGQSPFV